MPRPALQPQSRQRHRGPIGRVARQKKRRECQDERQARDDEAQPTQHGAYWPPKPPRAVDRQLGRCRAGEKVRRSDGIFELLGLDPVPLLDAHPPEQDDVGRGPSEPDAPETAPLLADGAKGDPR